MRIRPVALRAVAFLIAHATIALAQGSGLSIEGPPAPEAPAVIARDEQGRISVRAVRVQTPVDVDGVLSEAVYETTPSMTGFIQSEPRPGAPATEQTEVWLLFDGINIYVSARCWDSDPSTIVSNELRRDNNNIFNGNDIISVIFDSFYDRRNGFMLTTNPSAGRSEGQTTNERQYNGDWNPVWRVRTARFDQGWTVEISIPFKSIRYGSAPGQLWGFNVMRVKRSKTEISFLRAMPPARGQQGIQQTSMAATVVGLEAPGAGRTLDFKPFVTSNVTSDLRALEPTRNIFGRDAGLDAKYTLTDGLSGDLTVRTDFAQVEADEQQINLTRFSLFFPEKRDFFLENQGVFAFGGVPNSGNNAGLGDAPIMFYSRRIGLNQGRVVPLQVGGRVTGQAGRYGLGMLNIQTGDDGLAGRPATTPSTNFSVARLRRDILRKSSIGLLATRRSVSQTGEGASTLVGVDSALSFYDNFIISSYWARTDSEGVRDDNTSYRSHLDYNGDRYGVQLERLAIGDNFNPEMGFARRDNMRRNFAQARFSPRLRGSRSIRKLWSTGFLTYITGGDGRLESRDQSVELAIDFLNNDRLAFTYSDIYELLRVPFRIAPTVIVPVGGYPFNNFKLNYNMGQQRPIGANITLEHGRFYSGEKTTLSVARGRIRVTGRMSAEPTYTINRVTLAEGAFTTHLAGGRFTYTMTPLMFTSTLLQYSSVTNAVAVNARLRWEYQPGSELFVVYNEERNTLTPGFPGLNNRAFIIKVNRLFRF
jgi:hypothetical protein